MTPSQHLTAILREIDLPKDKYVIGGSGVLALRDIRQVRDVDIFVRRSLWNKLETSSEWVRWDPDQNDELRMNDPPYLIRMVNGVEVNLFYDWKRRGYLVSVEYHLDNAEWVKCEDGSEWPCIALNHLLVWKQNLSTQRPKDKVDARLIEDYLANGGV